ncbi:peptidase inhibitor family I36 protein [Nostoc sp.]
MKTVLLSGSVVALTVGIGVIISGVRPNVANAQAVPDCPLNSFCVWTERNFTGNRLVKTPTVQTLSAYLSTCSGTISSRIVYRSIRNNTLCTVRLFIQEIPNLQNEVTEISTNSQLADSGEFRSAR